MPSTNGHGPAKPTAILYSRVSTDEQARSGYSLAQQLEALRQHAKREGYEVLEEVMDAGQSGASLGRPGLDRVRDLVAAGGVSVVLAQDRDRFAREPAYLYVLREEFRERGTRLKALNERGDESPEAELTDGILDQLAKYERAKTAERSRRGKRQKVREGKIVAGPAPAYGFRFNNAHDGYEAEEQQMAVVGRIFRRVGAEGMSLRGVVSALNSEGAKLPVSTSNKSGRWGVTFVRDHIIKDDLYKPHAFEELLDLVAAGNLDKQVLERLDPNKTYGVAWLNKGRTYTTQVAVIDDEGRRRYKKRRRFVEHPRSEWVAVPVPLGDPPPAPRALVEAAREAIKDNRVPSTAARRFWDLSGGGILRCALCGGRMAPHSWAKPSGKRYYYYRCVTRWQYGTCEHKKTHDAKDLEAEVWQKVRGVMLDPARLRDDLDAMIEAQRRTYRTDPDVERKRWLDVLADAEHKRANYQRAFAADAMTLADLKARNAEIEAHEQTARAEIAVLRDRAQKIANLERERDALLAEYEGISAEALDSLAPEQRHRFYKSAGLSVLAHPDGAIEIVLGNLLSAAEVCEYDTTQG